MSSQKSNNVATFNRINFQIKAEEIRVLDEEGKQIGVMSVADALAKAREVNSDLVEIAPKAKPPVCKIIDFKKFKYIEAKKNKGTAQKAKQSELKEVRVTPFIGQSDLENRLSRAKKFLDQKHQVKITVRFKGRQMQKRDFGYKLMDYFVENLQEYAKIHQEPKFIGRQLSMIVMPDDKAKKQEVKD